MFTPKKLNMNGLEKKEKRQMLLKNLSVEYSQLYDEKFENSSEGTFCLATVALEGISLFISLYKELITYHDV